MWARKVILMIFLIPNHLFSAEVNITLKEEAMEYLKYLDRIDTSYYHQDRLLSWAYDTNMTDENLKNLEDFEASATFDYEIFPWKEFDDADMLRQADHYGLLIPRKVYRSSYKTNVALQSVVEAMTEVFSTLKICSYKDKQICNITYNPDLKEIFRTSKDPDELEYYWTEYHDQLSLRIKQNFSDSVKLSNKLSQFFNYSNRAENWIAEGYENTSLNIFENLMKGLYNQLKPLYLQLHAYIRGRLYNYYGDCVVNKTGPIHVHLTGFITGEVFQNIIDIIKPYPKKPSIDVTNQLIKQKYTTRRMASICDEFYSSLGLPPMPDTFWNYSQFEKPKGRDSTCITAAWDMFDNKDYRLLTCASINMDDMMGFCHEMGHLQFSMGAKDLPFCYKSAINSAINEGWADVSALSISTMKHLGNLKLVEDTCEVDHEVDINNLFFTALDKVVFLPYGLIVDLFRWDYFRGSITDDNANSKWWKLRLDYQGLAPPKQRSDKVLDIFDKVHVVTNTPFIEYFLAYVIQFQMHQSLCIAAGQYDPKNPKSQTLDKCDITGSKEAGKLLKNMFALGDSKPWLDVLKAITGHSEIDASPISNYFATLYKWLRKENKKEGNVIGW